MSPNLCAFLRTITVSELGRSVIIQSDLGYDVIVGSTPDRVIKFTSYADHPRHFVKINSLGIVSTAAGAYQILAHYFDIYKKDLNLPDFGPASQDAIATQMIRECGALADIEAGRIEVALSKCKSRWASLPGAGYGQHENKLEELLAAFETERKALA